MGRSSGPHMTPNELRRWRRRRFPADTEKASREQAIAWYGLRSRRAWEHYEAGTRGIPTTLVKRIRDEGAR